MMNVECLEDCLEIVERVVFVFGNGKMPADRAALVALLTDKFARPENLAPDMPARLSLAEWEELYDLEQHLNEVIAGHYH